jgi:hypothetical protein
MVQQLPLATATENLFAGKRRHKKNSVCFYGQNLHGQCLRLTSLSGFQKHADAHVQTMTPIIHQTAQSPLVSYQSETRSSRLVQQFAKDAWKK